MIHDDDIIMLRIKVLKSMCPHQSMSVYVSIFSPLSLCASKSIDILWIAEVRILKKHFFLDY